MTVTKGGRTRKYKGGGTVKPNEEKAHAVYSASGSSRWLSCPASITLSEKAPPQRESPYALEGTRAHECFEAFLKNGKTAAKKTKDMLFGSYPQDMVEHTHDAAIEVWNRASNLPILSETKVDLSFISPNMWGTVDAAIVDEFGRLTVIDYKHGIGHTVDPINNSQLAYYALGLSHKYEHNFLDVAMVIIQPRARDESAPVKEWIASIDELRAWEDVFRKGIAACEDPFSDYVAGDHCRWCPAKTICPAISDRAMVQAQIDFNPSIGQIAGLPVPQNFTLPNLGRVLDACKRLEVWIEAVREHALMVMERGGEVDGFKLVQKRSTRKWLPGTEAILEKSFSDAEIYEKKLLSPAQFEKKFKYKKELLAAYTTNESSGVTIVETTDKRQAINQINVDFASLPDTVASDGVATVNDDSPADDVAAAFETDEPQGLAVLKRKRKKKAAPNAVPKKKVAKKAIKKPLPKAATKNIKLKKKATKKKAKPVKKAKRKSR
jgi:hypothetical protein